MDRPAWRWWWASAVGFVAAVSVFAPLLGSNFIWDDRVVILEDERVHDPALWGRFFSEPYHAGVDKLYRPLVSLSYAVQWQLHGANAFAYHLVNLLAHGICAAMVAALGGRWFGLRAGVVAGLLFAVHPVYTEVVATVAYRTESFAACFALGAVMLATRPLSPARIAGVAILWLAAMLCKESVVTLGLLLPLFAWLSMRDDLTAEQRRLLRGFFAAMLLATAVYLVVRESIVPMAWDRARLLDWTINAVTVAEGVHRGLLPVAILGRYVASYCWPAGLSVDYQGVLWPQVTATDPYLWIGLAALAAWVGAVAVLWRRRADHGLICLLAMAASYFVISNAVVLIGTQLGDRLLYLPGAFGAMLAGAGLSRWRLGVVVAVCVAIALLVRSIDYQQHWQNDWTITQHSARQRPGSVRAAMIFAHMQRQSGDLAAAMQTLEQAREEYPVYPDLWEMSARYARQAGRSAEADALARRAGELERVYPNNRVNRRQMMEPRFAE